MENFVICTVCSSAGVGKLQPIGHKWPTSKFLLAHLPFDKNQHFAVFLCCAVRNLDYIYNRTPNSEWGRILGKGHYCSRVACIDKCCQKPTHCVCIYLASRICFLRRRLYKELIQIKAESAALV